MRMPLGDEVNWAVGDRVRLTQQMPHGRGCWTSGIEGEVVGLSQEKTGAWYAHSRNDKLWLDRMVILQDDGDVIDCILDQYSVLERVPARLVQER